MATYIAFLRAINVGSRQVKMQALREHLTAAGFGDVETHIQSGNVRLTSRARSGGRVAELMEEALEAALGFGVTTIVRTPAELSALIRDAPANPLGTDARHYVFLLTEPPGTEAADQLDGWRVDGERLGLVGRDAHLWLTGSFHKAKASNARIEKIVKGTSTARDWTVVSALAAKWGT